MLLKLLATVSSMLGNADTVVIELEGWAVDFDVTAVTVWQFCLCGIAEERVAEGLKMTPKNAFK